MNPAEDNFSDSDQSDEDFCPRKDSEARDSDTGSEEDSDDEVSDADQTSEHQSKQVATNENKTNRKSDNHSLEEQVHRKYSTRQANDGNSNNKGKIEKDALESDEEEKSRTDALWADFLSDVKAVPRGKQENVSQNRSSVKSVNDVSTNSLYEEPQENQQSSEHIQSEKKPTVTEVVNFASEEVHAKKMHTNNGLKTLVQPPLLTKGCKRPIPAASGLNSILHQIGKKKKISVLEKSQDDWNSFKQKEGITNELKTHNKGKDGYLDRQDFLERTDLRQFEIERNLRQSKRNN